MASGFNDLLDHLVGAAEQRRRHSRHSVLAPGVAAMSFERTKDPLAEGVRHY